MSAPAVPEIEIQPAKPASAVIHVAVGVISNAAGEVLITRRPSHVHQGDRWEFPGGKVDPGEDVRLALAREIEEEVGLSIEAARPLIRLRHDYPARSVLLDAWRITAYRGKACGREGQQVAWRDPSMLNPAEFPAANPPLITALRIPPFYLITPEPQPPFPEFLSRLESLLAAGIRLVQLRAKTLRAAEFRHLAAEVIALCRAYRAQVLLNTEPEQALALGADGVHLSSERLLLHPVRPLPAQRLVAASCHNLREIEHAGRICADFIAVSPVRATRSHPSVPVLDWPGLQALADVANIPVYALGGLGPGDLGTAWRQGAQGIAAIRSLWEAPDPAGLLRSYFTD
jgi:8-oxo-dGTP diphosphatase